MSWVGTQGFLRRLLANDARTATARERTAVARAMAPTPLDPGLARLSAPEGTTVEGTVDVGEFLEHPDLRLVAPLRTLPVHTLAVGGTGTGKTFLMLRLLLARVRAFAMDEASDRQFVVDPKDELDGLLEDGIAALLPTLPDAAAERLLSNLVRIDPFSSDALVPFNILRPEPGTDPDAAAWAFAVLLGRVAGAHLGINQDGFVHAVHLLGQDLAAGAHGCTLIDLARLIDNPADLRSAGVASANPSVRSYFAAPRLPTASLHGVRARLQRLLRLRGARRMFGARDCISFGSLLRDRVSILSAGSAPLGSRDIADFWLGLFMDRIVAAIFARTGAEVPVTLTLDEWQLIATAAGWVAEDFERVLAVCRSRRAHLALACQSLDSIRRVSAALPGVALTNVDVRLLFRSDIDDARAVSHLLPVSGRRHREPPRPWEEVARDPFLSPAEERNALVDRLTRLRTREFLFADRTGGGPGAFVRTAELSVRRPRNIQPATALRLARCALALPPGEEHQGPAPDVRAARQAGLFRQAVDQPAPALPQRRRRLGG